MTDEELARRRIEHSRLVDISLGLSMGALIGLTFGMVTFFTDSALPLVVLVCVVAEITVPEAKASLITLGVLSYVVVLVLNQAAVPGPTFIARAGAIIPVALMIIGAGLGALLIHRVFPRR